MNLSSIVRKGLIEVFPLSGKIMGGSKEKFTVKICPGMPARILEKFTVQIAYFEPEII